MTTRRLAEFTDAFAVPGQESVIDMVHPDTGRSMVYGETVDQIRVRYPGAEVVNFEAWMAAKAERQHTPIVWQASTEARYHYMLGVLPPVEYQRGGFLVGEPVDHDAGTGQPRFAGFRQRAGTFTESNRPMTLTEFRAEMGA